MKHCAICDKPLPFGRSKYCSDRCYLASKKDYRKQYYADPANAAKAKALVQAWRVANRDYYNAFRRDLYAQRKAEAFARVLALCGRDASRD